MLLFLFGILLLVFVWLVLSFSYVGLFLLRLFFLIEASSPKLPVTLERPDSPFYVCLVICLPSQESNLLEDRALSALFFTVFPVPDAA